MKIAIIGSGIAGLSAAWLLSRRHKVILYERERRLGGHSNTVMVETKNGAVPVDTGFIVYNERNYPNLTALFSEIQVPTRKSDMSFAASLRGGDFEYSGTNLNGLFGQRRNICRPVFWKMLRDLRRFYSEAPADLAKGHATGRTLGRYLRERSYSASFIENHILPMGAAIWSATAREMKAYPADAFIRFFESHGLLQIASRPQWRTVEGGSISYIHRLSQSLGGNIRYSRVARVRRLGHAVRVIDSCGAEDDFDHVVIASHADQALVILDDADSLERQLLGPWRYTSNRAYLHEDDGLMPRRRRVWSSWNFIDAGTSSEPTPLCVSYWMNRLQSLPTDEQIFVTLNPPSEHTPKEYIAAIDYEHPFFDTDAMATQPDLWDLQGRRRTWFCGSYFGYGFHEDALESGLAVAEQLGGVARPWIVAEGRARVQVKDLNMAKVA